MREALQVLWACAWVSWGEKRQRREGAQEGGRHPQWEDFMEEGAVALGVTDWGVAMGGRAEGGGRQAQRWEEGWELLRCPWCQLTGFSRHASSSPPLPSCPRSLGKSSEHVL